MAGNNDDDFSDTIQIDLRFGPVRMLTPFQHPAATEHVDLRTHGNGMLS